ncbi:MULTISPECIES: aminoacyl-tRNA deacylase [Aerococcus]|uniref:aminoacyl-tRNA deacylase n=1 Tax=Aerococcus TaxID=1375 RepID=UPI000A9005CE|nr:MULTISPECIES: aminoacyl-tRNA deacylase [Aerococcus]MDK7909126.1 aminoacyl-tRNA deacylase [Aerococcus urinae]MDK8609485.1 aminoacyl-tRNA deacylase [Aerococcus urinae]WIK91684.1 aminoacyl-tRNA deacylase [Aerococcus loyolae]
MSKKHKKTNAMRLLDQAKISYEEAIIPYRDGSFQPQEGKSSYKTLVARTHDHEIVVFVIPLDQEFDLKQCARVINSKRVELVHVKELLDLTGYVRGGCSPLGMKKKYRTWYNDSCLKEEEIFVSAGERGKQIGLDPKALIEVTQGKVGHLIR